MAVVPNHLVPVRGTVMVSLLKIRHLPENIDSGSSSRLGTLRPDEIWRNRVVQGCSGTSFPPFQ